MILQDLKERLKMEKEKFSEYIKPEVEKAVSMMKEDFEKGNIVIVIGA